jgi:hypothetical protein
MPIIAPRPSPPFATQFEIHITDTLYVSQQGTAVCFYLRDLYGTTLGTFSAVLSPREVTIIKGKLLMYWPIKRLND